MFGRLEYILLIATAGTLLQVEALAVWCTYAHHCCPCLHGEKLGYCSFYLPASQSHLLASGHLARSTALLPVSCLALALSRFMLPSKINHNLA